MRKILGMTMLGALLMGCGVNTHGLKDAASADLSCDGPMKTREIFSGYGEYDAVARVEVTGCERRAVFTKYAPGKWVQSTEADIARNDTQR